MESRNNEDWDAKEEYGDSIMDDAMHWVPNFRVDAFPPGCLTISGALSLAIGVLFLLAAFVNVVLPHYDRIQYSVQTRCQIMGIKDDNLLDDQLQHFGVKFPLPGIEGLMDGEILCFGTQNCAKYTEGSVHDCYFDTEDHSLSFYTAMSGHHSIRLFSYVLLCMPCLLGALCCLVPASAHWRRQLNKIAHDGRDAFAKIHVDPVPYDQQRHEAQQRAQYQQEYNSLAQAEMGYAGGYQQQDNMRGSSEGRDRFQGEEEGGGMSNYNWMKMQMGL